MASVARKDLLKKVYNMVPPMLESFHKGKFALEAAKKRSANTFDRSAWSRSSHWW
jgi:hypothetical protein